MKKQHYIILTFLTLILVTILTFTICEKASCVNVETLPREFSNYKNLPTEVQFAYAENFKKENSLKQRFINLNIEINFQFETTTIDDGPIVFFTKGYYHWVKSKDLCFKLEANKNSPMIIFKNKLYYPFKKNFNDSLPSFIVDKYVSYKLW